MNTCLRTTFNGALLAATLTLLPAAPAAAQAISFTIDGQITNAGQGYTPGTPVQFTWVLDDAAARLARYSSPGASCCSGGLAWYQDLFSTTPQLWSSISGTGLAGNWQPPADSDDGSINLSVGNFPQPYTANFGMLANARIGVNTGLQVNGFDVTALQVSAVFTGLDAVAALGLGTVFSTTPVDPSVLFSALAGTYAVNRTFSDFGGIWGRGAGPSQAIFRVDQLTIAPVPEPGSGALWLSGGVALWLWVRRRKTV